MAGIPVLTASGENIPEAWENSLFSLIRYGCDMPTQYDKKDDPPSIDSTMLITVSEPLSEPVIHRDMPGGLRDLEQYTLEITHGIKNHRIRDKNDPDDNRWGYTYHNRLTAYHGCFNQLENVISRLSRSPFSRRIQGITWYVSDDSYSEDPPCLQSLHFRISEKNNQKYLNMNVRFRSNDAYLAAFMNMYSLVRLQEIIAYRVSLETGEEIKLGRYCHIADSYHIYGKDRDLFDNRFMRMVDKRNFEDRTYRYCDVEKEMEEYRNEILSEKDSIISYDLLKNTGDAENG